MNKDTYAIYTGEFLEDMKAYFEEHRIACEELCRLCQNRSTMEVLDAIRFVEGQRND